jgi:hypothetical protein
MLILRFFVKIAPESLLHQARIQQFWKRGPRLLFANFYPIYTLILLNDPPVCINKGNNKITELQICTHS